MRPGGFTKTPGSHARRGNPSLDALRRETVTVHDRTTPARRACKTGVPTRSVGTRRWGKVGRRGGDEELAHCQGGLDCSGRPRYRPAPHPGMDSGPTRQGCSTMRRLGPLLYGLWTLSLVGCLSSSTARSTNWLDRLHPFRSTTANDTIPMDVAILEGPVGDSFLNQGLWEQADEQVVALDRKAVLDDNGFRVGQFGDVMPARLQ